MAIPDASVEVVPARDEEARLERTLDSLSAQVYDGELEDTDLSLRLRREGTVVSDHTCPVATSTRRQERVGYARLFLTYLVGYLENVLPSRTPSRASR